jgi:hypothetical protein
LPEKPAWDDRLLPRERAYRLAGEWPLKISTHRGEHGLDLRLNCTKCKLSCGTIQYRQMDLDDLVSMVIRHRVMHHQLVLSGAANGQRPGVAEAYGVHGLDRTGRVPDPAGYRPGY